MNPGKEHYYLSHRGWYWAEQVIANTARNDPAFCAMVLYSAGWRTAERLHPMRQFIDAVFHPIHRGGKRFEKCPFNVAHLMSEIEQHELMHEVCQHVADHP